MPSVGIIGTAGRKGSHVRLSSDIFNKMVARAEHIITKQLGLSWNNVNLVSGGAAWADHVAVMVYMSHFEDCSLTLHLPCAWKTKAFEDTGVNDWRKNPGKTANHLHNLFSKMVDRDTLFDIDFASQLGANLNCDSKGFHNRNSAIAKSDYLIAFTWGKDKPEDGGTLDTWKKATGSKFHVSLSELEENKGSNKNTHKDNKDETKRKSTEEEEPTDAKRRKKSYATHIDQFCIPIK